MFTYFRVLFLPLTLVLFLSTSVASAQDAVQSSAEVLWREATVEKQGQSPDGASPTRLYELDASGFDALLDRASMESSHAAMSLLETLALPMPDGSLELFRIEESPIMEPELAAKFPEIRTFVLQGLDKPAIHGRLDRNHREMHAVLLSPEGVVQVNPDYREGHPFYRSSYERPQADGLICQAENTPGSDLVKALESDAEPETGVPEDSALKGNPSGDMLRAYRLAVATTGEYYAGRDSGNGDSDVLASIATVINRVNAIYETEVAIRFLLVAGNDQLLFTDPTTDGYSNNSPCTMRIENTSNIEAVISSDEYDVGHVFGTSPGGGCASGSVVCGSNKGAGASGLNVNRSPGQEGFSGYRLVSHEIGHQFGASHTWSGASGNCTSGQFRPGSAYEPLGGTTLMSYSGTCGGDNIQSTAADIYFHTHSFDQIVSFATAGGGDGCAGKTSTGNAIPQVQAGPDYTIPRDTPFILTGSAVDANDALLSYAWEQYDRTPVRVPSPLEDKGDNPLFRSFPPREGEPSRTFPQLSDILNGPVSPMNPVEVLPTTDRTLSFRLTARDNRAGGGGVDYDEMVVDVQGDPFSIMNPNGGEILKSGCPLPVTWIVGGGSVANEVNLLFSENGGSDFRQLEGASANDGSQEVSVCTATGQGRFKVEASDNIFFDISNSDFTIVQTAPEVIGAAVGGDADDRCEFLVPFIATATDDCGLDAADVDVQLLPTGSGFSLGPPTVNASQNGALTVDVSGSVLVSGLTSAEANLDIAISAADNCGVEDTDTVRVTVRDVTPPDGSIISPQECECFGTAVTVTDDFADACNGNLTKNYFPGPGPFVDHGDHRVALTVTDAAGLTATDEKSFTIDLVPPESRIVSPEAKTYGDVAEFPVPVSLTSRDDDGATGGVVHEQVFLDGELLFDGNLVGDLDGRLSDEAAGTGGSPPLALDLAILCDSTVGLRGEHTLTVVTEDCGGNTAEDMVHFDVSISEALCTPRHTLVINEVDYDQGVVDSGEFIEIKNTGSEIVDLRDYSLHTYYYRTFETHPRFERYSLPDRPLGPGEYFVVCTDDNPEPYCQHRVVPKGWAGIPPIELLREHGPAAVSLVFSEGPIPYQDQFVDSVCYIGSEMFGDPGYGLVGALPGISLEEIKCNSQIEILPGAGVSRVPDGRDGDHNLADFRQACISPGSGNFASTRDCPLGRELGRLVINELDYNQPEHPDASEFVEIKNVGSTAANLGDYEIIHRFRNQSPFDSSAFPQENRASLPPVLLMPGQYYVLCRTAGVPNCDAEGLFALHDSNGAVAIVHNVTGLPEHDILVDSIVYGEINSATTGGPLSGGAWAEGNPQTTRDGVGATSGIPGTGLSRICDGADMDDNATDFRLVPATPGAKNEHPD